MAEEKNTKSKTDNKTDDKVDSKSNDKVEDKTKNTSKDYTYNLDQDKKESTVKIDVEVNKDRFDKVKERVYERMAKDVEIKGFRKGKAPRKVVEAQIWQKLMQQTLNELLPIVTQEIVLKEKIQPATAPKYDFKNLTKDMEISFSVEFTTIPEVKLTDLTKLQVKKDDVKVTKKDVDELLDRLKKEYKENQKATEEKQESKKSEEKKKVEKSKKDEEEIDWTEIFQNPKIKTEKDVREYLKENLELRKKQEAEQRYETQLVEKGVENSEIKAPKELVDQQIQKYEDDYRKRIESVGLKLEDFLKSQKKTLEDLREEWEKQARFFVESDLLFSAIAKEHKLKVEEDEVQKEIDKIEKEDLKKQYESDQGKSYIATVLIRQKAVKKLKDLADQDQKKDQEKAK
jgi:trigger factor